MGEAVPRATGDETHRSPGRDTSLITSPSSVESLPLPPAPDTSQGFIIHMEQACELVECVFTLPICVDIIQQLVPTK